MPYFPSEDDNAITLTMNNGDSVTLVEKELSVADRKAVIKRSLLLQSEFEYKRRQGEAIDKRIADAALDKDAFDKAAEEQAELIAGISIFEVYATVLPMRFASWDVFASRADFEAKKPVAMTKEAIAEFAYARKQNGALLEEIVTKLRKHDEGEEKKDESAPADGGSVFTATPH